MNTISPIELFIALFIGMGPIKVLLVYIAMTEGMEKEVRRQVAKRTVLVAGGVGLGLSWSAPYCRPCCISRSAR